MMSKMLNGEIKFGVMCTSSILRHWEVECIRDALSVNGVKLALIIHPPKRQLINRKNFIEKKSYPEFSSFLYNVYKRLFLRPESCSPIEFSYEFKNVPTMYCQSILRNSNEYFVEEDVEKIKSAGLDFIIAFSGFEYLKGEILNAARYGIWFYHFSDIEKYNSHQPCFWEIYEDDYVCGASLQKMTSKTNEVIVLKKGYFKIFEHSYKKSVDNVCFESSRWIKDVCTELQNGSVDFFDNITEVKDITEYSQPHNIDVIKFCIKLLKNKLIKTYFNLFIIEQWNIGYINKSSRELLEKNNAINIHWLPSPPKNICFCDPFLIKLHKTFYILFEKLIFQTHKGIISAIKIDSKVKSRNPETVLEMPYHLSYPFTFKYKNDIYMLPEQWRYNEIVLYKAIEFPFKWEKIACLVKDLSAVDITLFKHNDIWWMTFTQKKEGPDLRLYIYYSNNLLGPWKPHKKNPVKTDVRSSHSAGKVFKYKNFLIRPAQDCSKTYGGRIVLNKIVTLNPDEFKEETYAYLNPNPEDKFNKGIHTINSIDKITVVDGKRNVFYIKKTKKIIEEKFSNYFVQKTPSRYKFINIPKFFDKNKYYKAINNIVDSLKNQRSIISIYQFGGINHPGISDVDILVVFDGDKPNNYDPILFLSKGNRYFFTHNLTGICRYHFRNMNKFIHLHNLNHLWGEQIEFEENKISKSEIEAIRSQTAMEYLIKNYIDLTMQLKYRVIRLRSTLQHLKAIRYDLEFLNISSSKLYNMVIQLQSRMEEWFIKPFEHSKFCDWIDEFYIVLEKLIESHLNHNKLYFPTDADLELSYNIKLEYGKSLSHKFQGLLFPKFMNSLNKKIYNLNSRFNKFIFKIPFSYNTENKILKERISFFREIDEHLSKYYPSFSPLSTGMDFKIITKSM